MSVRSVRIVLDEEKILREGKYKLDELYAYLDEIAKEAKLTKQDKYNYLSSGDKNDLARVGIFTINNARHNEAITRNVKEWWWLKDGKPYINIVEDLKSKGLGVWECNENQNLEFDTHIKCINFDLSTEELRKHFGDNISEAYEQIAKFFFSKGFDKQQYSGYISKEPLNDTTVLLIMEELGAKFTWLDNCIQKFDVSNAPEKRDVRELIIKGAEEKIQTLTQKLDREVSYYEKSKNSFYADVKIRIENTIISLCNELMQNGEIIKDKNLKTFQTIIKERNGGREL